MAVGICSVLIAAIMSVACSSSEHPATIGVGDPNSSAGTGNSSGNGSLDFGGMGNSANGTGNSGTGATLGDACAADVSTAQAIPLDMYIMLDVSTSMLEPTAAVTSKWDAVKTAIESFLKDNASADLGVGIQYFPIELPNVPASCNTDAQCGAAGPCFARFCFNYDDGKGTFLLCDNDTDCIIGKTDVGPCAKLAACSEGVHYLCDGPGLSCGSENGVDQGTCTAQTPTCANPDSCDVTGYSTPATPIAALPGAANALVASIDAQTPSGNTPTGPALSGAIAQASTWAKAHPDHRVITVLATDGLPTSCTPNDIASVAAIAKAGAAANPVISTFVIGVFGTEDVAKGAPDNLNLIAQQGGTQAAFIVDTQKDVTAQFLAALDTIRGARLACEFKIPQPMSGTDTLDYGRVNVQFTDGNTKDLVYYVTTAAGCDATSGGWYYDVDPATGAIPTKIIACPTSCTTFQGAANGASVGIALGCTTIVK
ncbi:MAG: VWA domain-containing protein [Myxococcales bacterium]